MPSWALPQARPSATTRILNYARRIVHRCVIWALLEALLRGSENLDLSLTLANLTCAERGHIENFETFSRSHSLQLTSSTCISTASVGRRLIEIPDHSPFIPSLATSNKALTCVLCMVGGPVRPSSALEDSKLTHSLDDSFAPTVH
jgi:hypothetical protein